MFFRSVLFIGGCLVASALCAQTRILFDASKAESAGNADWVIDADLHNLDWNPTGATGSGSLYTASNPQQIPTPAQSGVGANTAETYWEGALSAWAVDCAKQGYVVESLPYNGQITFNNAGNPQDLSRYKVFVVDEPNIRFSASEKTAILQWVAAGGGLFMISDHDQSDRNNDGWDSPAIWNDLMSSNGIAANPFGISFDLASFSETSGNVQAAATDSIIHGTWGNVTSVKWSSGTSMTLSSSANPTVKGVVFRSGSSAGNSNVLVAYARYGAGKVAAIGDSSPTDDGSGNPACNLYNGYFTDAAGNHQRLLMNATVWLARAGSVSTAVPDLRTDASLHISAGRGFVRLQSDRQLPACRLYDGLGRLLATRPAGGASATFEGLRPGIYWIQAAGATRTAATSVAVF
ncbi:hypothetical protein [Flaviaesturariibacter terrae]